MWISLACRYILTVLMQKVNTRTKTLVLCKNLEYQANQIYSEVSPILVIEAYYQETVLKIPALITFYNIINYIHFCHLQKQLIQPGCLC